MPIDLSNLDSDTQTECQKLMSRIANIDNTLERFEKTGLQSRSFGGQSQSFHGFDSLMAQRDRLESRLFTLTGSSYSMLRGVIDMRRWPSI